MIIFCVLIFMCCLFLRIIRVNDTPIQLSKSFTMTHLRIDSLLLGVLVSFFYHFHFEAFKLFYIKYKYFLIALLIPILLFPAFYDPFKTSFILTIGFTLLFVGFGILLTIFLFEEGINTFLNNLLTEKLVDIIAMIGLSSYSIYVIHQLINSLTDGWNTYNHYYGFLLNLLLSCLVGYFLTISIEKYFLNIRDRMYPSSVRQVPIKEK